MAEKITWTKKEIENMPSTIGEAIKLNVRYFFTGKKCRNNHLSPRHSDSGKCVECKRVANRKSRAKYRKKERTEVASSANCGKITHGLSRSIEMKLYNTAKIRAKKKDIEFTIKVTDIAIPDKCPILGILINKIWGSVNQNNKERYNKPSLDRLDPRIGYTPSNIVVISYRANMIKGDGFPDEHRKIAEFLKSHNL